MPIYEYQCQGCSKVFEEMVLPGKPEPRVCPVCGAEISRVISAPSFHLKGEGWYVTDYKKSGASAPAPATPASTASPTPAASPASPTEAPAATVTSSDT